MPEQKDDPKPLLPQGLYAFPSSVVVNDGQTVRWAAGPGMTLRDWFAGQALAAGAWQHEDPDKVADWTYQCADAMMKARGP